MNVGVKESNIRRLPDMFLKMRITLEQDHGYKEEIWV